MIIDHVGNITKEAGPVSMTFTIPMYNASRLQVKICSLLIVKIIHGHLVSWVGLGTIMSLMIVIGSIFISISMFSSSEMSKRLPRNSYPLKWEVSHSLATLVEIVKPFINEHFCSVRCAIMCIIPLSIRVCVCVLLQNTSVELF